MSLSPGTWHEEVPKGKLENIQWRLDLLDRCEGDGAAQAAVRLACSEDVLFWINAFVHQVNPQHVGEEDGPFITWDFQDEAIRTILECVEGRRDLVIEKSREMGASWMCLLVMCWLWLFRPSMKFLCISRDADQVDKRGDENSLFGKLDYVFDRLPDWMIRPCLKRRRMLIRNAANGSVITGQASTGKAGVGGRATAMFIDEFSQINEDYEVLHRTADTTRCRIFNFTHTGTHTAAYELTQRVDMRKLKLMWWDHPDKKVGLYQYSAEKKRVEVLDRVYQHPPDFNFVMDGKLRSPWYDEECGRRGNNKRAIACDLDCDPRGSMHQFFDRELIVPLVQTYACEPYWRGDLAYDGETGKPRELVKAKDGKLRLWMHLPRGVPEAGVYTMGADLASGTGATNSCLSVVNARTGEKVLEYADPYIRPDQLAPMAVALCWLLKDETGEGAKIAWEMQGPGAVFGPKVIELGYRNVYRRKDETNPLRQIESEQAGWYPSPNGKRLLLEEYRRALHRREFLNRSAEALEECLSFRYTRNSVEHAAAANEEDPSGATVNHGDRVIADALAWLLAREVYAPRKKAEVKSAEPGSLAWRRELVERRENREAAWA